MAASRGRDQRVLWSPFRLVAPGVASVEIQQVTRTSLVSAQQSATEPVRLALISHISLLFMSSTTPTLQRR